MITRAADHRIVENEKMRGGHGVIKLIHAFETEDLKGAGRMFAKSVIKPGCSIGEHPHNGEYEIYYIIKGTAKVTDNGRESILGPGDAMICQDGGTHSIENAGEEDVELIAAVLFPNDSRM